jgi:hypothetical protein
MPFVDISSLNAIERLPGWHGRDFSTVHSNKLHLIYAFCVSPLPLSFLPLVDAHPWFPRAGPFERTTHFFRRFPPQLLSNL